MRFGEKTRLVEMPVRWSLDDYPHFEYLRLPNAIMPGLKTPEDVFRNWTEDIAYMVRDFTDGVLVFTFHPQVIGRGHRMLGLPLASLCQTYRSGRYQWRLHAHRRTRATWVSIH
jgi:peptidoglycan-N-acetylglucosamine deacetylase